jgi:hypothetical protein
MERTMLEEHLTQAERHVARGELHITRQRRMIADLERNGQDAADAERLLATLEATQRLRLADRAWIEDELRFAGYLVIDHPMGVLRPYGFTLDKISYQE